jgi:DNA-binding CsgD family transcriptional regulator
MLVTGKHVLEVSMRKSSLTQRENEVIKLIADGNTVKQTASMLGLSAKTVEAHKSNLMRKLHVHNKAQLVTVAIQEKMLSIPSTR